MEIKKENEKEQNAHTNMQAHTKVCWLIQWLQSPLVLGLKNNEFIHIE
jgi:hypothetical protein